MGSKGGVVALASHQRCPGSNPGVEDAICGLSLLLFLSLAPRSFSPGTPLFLKANTSKFNSIWNARTRFNEFLRTAKCSVGKQLQLQTTLILGSSIPLQLPGIRLRRLRALNFSLSPPA